MLGRVSRPAQHDDPIRPWRPLPTLRALAAEATRSGRSLRRAARGVGPDALIVGGLGLIVFGLYLMFGAGPALVVLGLVVAALGWLVS